MVTEQTGWDSAWQLRERIAGGELSATDVMSACLARIHQLEPELHAFITVADEAALAGAERADAALISGHRLGPLHGVPVAVKDELWTAGIRSTGGSLLYRDFVPAEDGVAARRLRAAGAIIVGKTNMPEFAVWPRSLSRVGGESVNPWDTRRTAGASSGGSAAALAAGMVPLAIGSDGGGSIRIPSSLCGVTGLFPTPGRVPSKGSFSYSPYASLGPMARDTRDLAILLGVLCGHDAADPTSSPRPVPDFLNALDRGVGGLRIAYASDLGFIPVEDGIVDVARATVEKLSGAGASVADVELELGDVPETFFVSTVGYGLFHDDGPMPFTRSAEFLHLCDEPANAELFTEYFSHARTQPPPTAEEFTRATEHLAELRARFEQLFQEFDLIATPTMHVTAPLVPQGWGTPYSDPWMGTAFTGIANLLGLPAASYPAGLSHGLPVGLQLIGRAWDEATVLRACRALELAAPWTHRAPCSAA